MALHTLLPFLMPGYLFSPSHLLLTHNLPISISGTDFSVLRLWAAHGPPSPCYKGRLSCLTSQSSPDTTHASLEPLETRQPDPCSPRVTMMDRYKRIRGHVTQGPTRCPSLPSVWSPVLHKFFASEFLSQLLLVRDASYLIYFLPGHLHSRLPCQPPI